MSDDTVFEISLQSDPYNLRTWLGYLKAKIDSPIIKRSILYERALSYLSRSYKLWAAYLEERTIYLQSRSIGDNRYETLINTYERALLQMSKMPRIWINYCKLLIRLNKGSATRKTFDRALRSLPVTQHAEIWELYVDWARNFGVPRTGKIVMKRYLIFDPGYRENFIEWCIDQNETVEAMQQLKILHDTEEFVSVKDRTRMTCFMELCALCSSNPTHVADAGIDMNDLIRQGLSIYPDQSGKLWCYLATFNVRHGHFEKARETFEEAINTVLTVKDFSVVFDAAVKVEESTLVALMQSGVAHDSPEMEERVQHIERMLEKRPLLLNSVLLRQNPSNVHEWLKRVELIEQQIRDGDAASEASTDASNLLEQTYLDALQGIDPENTVGRVSLLWAGLASHYEKNGDMKKCRETWERAVEGQIKNPEELALMHCGWAEVEIRAGQPEEALRLMKASVTLEGKIGVSAVACNSVKVWALYLDLVESLGTADDVRAAYDEAMKRKAATAQMCINYASYLEEASCFEESFRVFERSVDLFIFPQVKEIWLAYIDKFTSRYGGTKLERLRDLYEQAVKDVPVSPDAVELYLHYGKAEEKYGQPRHVIAVYDRATAAVPEENKLAMYSLYVKKIRDSMGPAKARPAYERAIKELRDEDACKICVDFAHLERDLRELDRARAIFAHGAQFANPAVSPEYWNSFRQFEEAHGNEDTFREMLRKQRAVEASYSHVRTDIVNMVRESKAEQTEDTHDGNGKRKFVAAGTEHAELEDGKRSRKNDDIGDGEVENVAFQSVPASIFASLEK